MSDMDPLYESMKDSAEDMSKAAVEMKTMMTADEMTDVDIEGYGPKPSFSKQIMKASNRTYFASPTDPDGTIAGLAGTEEGQWFRVAIQEASGVVIAFNNYRKVSGVAQFINSEPNATFVTQVRDMVVKEIADRTALINAQGKSGVIAIVDPNGFEAGRVTRSSVELEKLKIMQRDSGAVLAVFDELGYGVQVLADDGWPMVGRNKLKEVTELLSVLDPNGFAVKLMDTLGRLFVGRNMLFEVKGYTVCVIDQNGWVIWAITEDGYTISRDGGGEPTPSVLETSAVGHWLFGRETTSFKSRVSNRLLAPQSTPAFNGNYLTTAAWNGGLISDIPDAGEYTVCAVVRVPQQTAESDCVVIYGTQNGYSLRDDDDTYTGNQLSMFSDRDTPYQRRWLRSKISGYCGTSRDYPTFPAPVGEWLFVAHVVKLTGSGERYQVMQIGDGKWQELREADSNRLILSGRNVAVGNAYCDVAKFKTKGLEIAEFIYFDHALTASEVENVYNNSQVRMAERAIDLQ